MIRSLIICSALVASSAAGAVALSVLHDTTGDYTVRTLAPAPQETIEARFVIPTFAPAPKPAAPVVMEAALRDAPVMPTIGGTVTDETPVSLSSPVLEIVPAVVPSIAKSAPAPRVRPVSKTTKITPSAMATARAVRTQTVRTIQKRHSAPVIVTQTHAFSATARPSLAPEYLIGVYR